MKSLKSQTLTTVIFIIATISILSPCYCDLIEATCNKTPHYDLCVQTLKSDPSSSNADVAGLALIMVKVMKTKVGALSDKIKQLLKSGHLEPKQEEALRSCGVSYKIVLDTIIPSTQRALELGDPKFAEEGVLSIGVDAKRCEDRFSGTASPLTNENNALRDLADVAVAIVRLLL